jgi:hypothetical protein
VVGAVAVVWVMAVGPSLSLFSTLWVGHVRSG